MDALLIALIAAALYYLGSRALITRALWSRYPARLASFMDCSACTGFWYGLVLAAIVGRGFELSYLGLDLTHPASWVCVGLASIVTTPIVGGLMQHGLDKIGIIGPAPEPEPEPERKWTRLD